MTTTPKRIPASINLFRQRGASLLEGIAYLGIAAIVILGAVSLLTGAFSSASANQTAEEIISLRTATKKLYSGQAYTDGANLLQTLIPARALPGTLVVGANDTATNKWGGTVTVEGNGNSFTIEYTSMPQDVCVAVVSGANGWVSINTVALNGGVATAANARTVCANAGNANTVTFVAT